MKTAGLLLLLIASTTIAAAEPLPTPNRGGSCGNGYLASAGTCVPTRGAPDAIPLPPNGSCPWSWLRSGNQCLRSGR
jgi:hypothetical protein